MDKKLFYRLSDLHIERMNDCETRLSRQLAFRWLQLKDRLAARQVCRAWRCWLQSDDIRNVEFHELVPLISRKWTDAEQFSRKVENLALFVLRDLGVGLYCTQFSFDAHKLDEKSFNLCLCDENFIYVIAEHCKVLRELKLSAVALTKPATAALLNRFESNTLQVLTLYAMEDFCSIVNGKVQNDDDGEDHAFSWMLPESLTSLSMEACQAFQTLITNIPSNLRRLRLLYPRISDYCISSNNHLPRRLCESPVYILLFRFYSSFTLRDGRSITKPFISKD